MQNPGKITKENDGYQVVFDRVLHHPIQRVWNAITHPDELKYWFTDIDFDFREGGKMTIQFRDADKTKSYGEIVSIEAPNKFVWTWEDELAVWELTEIDEKTTRLLFVYSKVSGDYAVNVASGFHDLLQLLAERLDGSDKICPFGATADAPEFLPIRTRYAASVYNSLPELVKTPPVVIEKEMTAPVARVWKALTDKEEMKQWYFTLDDFKPVPGFQFSFPGQGSKGEHYMHKCIITEVIPEQKLQYSWQYEGFAGYSLVTFELFKLNNGTKVRVSHQGLESFPQELADFTRKSFTQGWTELIGKMLPDFVQQNVETSYESLTINRYLPVSQEVLFSTFTEPDFMRSWWTEDTDFEIDLRIGGKWKITRKEGEQTYIALGEYIELNAPEHVSYTYSMPQFSSNSDIISISIQPENEGSRLTFKQTGPDISSELKELVPGEISESEKGWQRGFDLIEKTYGK